MVLQKWQDNTILHHAQRELYTKLFRVKIRYDFWLRIETGTERPLLVYTWYRYKLLEVVNIKWLVKDWNEGREDPDVDILNISQKVQDTGIHLEVDEEQWNITQGSKRQAKWLWSPRTMSGLRLPDTPHAEHQTQRSTRLDRKQTKEHLASPWMTHVRVLCLKQTMVTILPKKSSMKIQLRRSHLIQKK